MTPLRPLGPAIARSVGDVTLDHLGARPDAHTVPTGARTTAPSPLAHRRGLRRQSVLLVDDHPLFAEILDLALSRAGYDVRRAEVPDNPARAATLMSQVCRSRPTTVLLDLNLGRFGDGARLIPSLVQSGSTVVVVTAEDDRARWGLCLLQGARKVVSKSDHLDEVVATLRRLDAGLPVLAPGEREELLRAWHERCVQQQEMRFRLDQLTVRESEILGHLTRGRTVREIASTSFVSEATVRTQVKAVLSKLGVCSQLAAVGLARSADWRSPVD